MSHPLKILSTLTKIEKRTTDPDEKAALKAARGAIARTYWDQRGRRGSNNGRGAAKAPITRSAAQRRRGDR